MDKSVGGNMKDIFKLEDKSWDVKKAKMLSPLQLAYIGDAVYELCVRTYLIEQSTLSVNELHREAVNFVKAKVQADVILSMEEELTEEEWSIVKRGRNAKTTSVPKNANLIDYKYATGFEALIGYLYLTGQKDRLSEIFHMTLKKVKGAL